MNDDKKIVLFKISVIWIVLSGITFLAYRNAIKGGLVWDAGSYLINNPYIMGLTWENIKWMFSTFFMANWHPLTWLSYTLDYVIYGEIWGVALTNIVLHCANVILMFFFSLFLIDAHHQRSFHFSGRSDKDLLAAFVAALLFGIHPQHVESVAWLAERKDVLCQFFVLMTFISYMIYVRFDGNRRRTFYFATLFFFIMAGLSKPMAVTVPFLLLLGDFYPLRRIPLMESNKKKNLNKIWFPLGKLLIEKLPFFLLSFSLIIVTILAQKAAINPIEKFGLQARVFNAFNSYIIYISKLIFPINLLPLYDEFPKLNNWTSLVPIISFFMITTLFIYFWFNRRQYYWLAAWLFYLIALSPVIGILKVGVQSSADRYTYLPTVPFYVLAGYGFAILIFKLKHMLLKIIVSFCMVVINAIFFVMTESQVVVWQNEFYLWNYIVKIVPDHGPANTGLGDFYFNRGNYEKAIEYYKKASEAGKLLVYSIPCWAIAYLKLEKLNEALQIYKAILDRKLKVEIPDSCINYNIGLIYAKLGLFDSSREFLFLVNLDSPKEFLKARQILSSLEKFNVNGVEQFSAYEYCEKSYIYTASHIYK